MCIMYIHVVFRFIWINACLLGQGLVVEVAMLQLHYGQQINSVVALLQRKNSKNGQVRLDQIFPSFSLREQPIALVEERLVKKLGTFHPQDAYLFIVTSCCPDSQCMSPIDIDNISQFWLDPIIVKRFMSLSRIQLKESWYKTLILLYIRWPSESSIYHCWFRSPRLTFITETFNNLVGTPGHFCHGWKGICLFLKYLMWSGLCNYCVRLWLQNSHAFITF